MVLAGSVRRTGEPDERLRIEMAETDLHARSMHETDHLYKCGLLKGPSPQPFKASARGAVASSFLLAASL